MGHTHSRRCQHEDDWYDSYGPRSYAHDERDDDDDGGFLHEGARRGLVPNETFQQYVDHLYKTYPADEITRLALEHPVSPTHVNSTISVLADICLRGLASQQMSYENLELAISRIEKEVSRDPASATQALIVFIDIGLAMMRYPGVHNEPIGGMLWVELENALLVGPETGADPATEKRLAWLRDVMQKLDVRVMVMESCDE